MPRCGKRGTKTLTMPSLALRLAPARFLDPALLIVVALGVGLWLYRGQPPRSPLSRRTRIGQIVAWSAWALLWTLSMPWVAGHLHGWIEMRGPDLGAALASADPARTALVVLAGGLRTYETSIPPRERLDAATQSRVLGAARLYHAHGFGTVVLSGAPEAESEAMEDLITTLGVPRDRLVRESTSLSTRQNAENCAQILRDRRIETVVLATSAAHLRRAVREFDRIGTQVIPAPVDITGVRSFGIDQLLPSASALGTSHRAIHEVLGYYKP
jgi:uncharacterized SAM-binding protein YcdF (DUF218 family)